MGRRYPALLEVATRSEELFSRGDANADGKLNTAEFEALSAPSLLCASPLPLCLALTAPFSL